MLEGDMNMSLYLLSRAIREQTKTALLGEIADALFGGFDWLNDPDIVYSESQGGAMTRRNLRTGERASIGPRRSLGQAVAQRYQFNWNTPYILSNHNPAPGKLRQQNVKLAR